MFSVCAACGCDVSRFYDKYVGNRYEWNGIHSCPGCVLIKESLNKRKEGFESRIPFYSWSGLLDGKGVLEFRFHLQSFGYDLHFDYLFKRIYNILGTLPFLEIDFTD